MTNHEKPKNVLKDEQDKLVKAHLGLPETATSEEIREAIFKQVRKAHEDPEFQKIVLEAWEPILQAHGKFGSEIGEHLIHAAENGKCTGLVALKLFAHITAGSEFGEENIALLVKEGKSYEEVEKWIKEQLTLEKVRKWLLENKQLQKYYGNMEWF